MCFVIYLDFPFNNHGETNKQTTERATTAELYPGRDTFVFDQGHVTKNQPITVLVLLSESLGNNCSYLLSTELRVISFKRWIRIDQ